MLKTLLIKNIALIDSLLIEFAGGLNVLSGETGAGKSIIIDSLNFILGDRADKTLLRHGESAASVEAVFDADGGNIGQILLELTGESDDIIIINRTLTADGKSEIRLNGRQISLSMLKKLTQQIADIHGQHEHQSLLKVSKHIEILDYFLPAEAAGIKGRLQELFKDYRQTQKELSAFGKDENERARQIDILSYQIKEIRDAKLSEKEESELLKKREIIINQERIAEGLARASAYLNGGGDEAAGAIETLDGAIHAVSGISRYDARFGDYCARAESARAELADIADSLSAILEETDYSEKDADNLERRLDAIKLIKRKYGGDIAAAKEFLENAEQEFNKLTNGAEIIENLKKQTAKLEKEILGKCRALSALRRKTALEFEAKVKKELSDVGMAGAAFKARFSDEFAAESYADGLPEYANANGFDIVEFYLSPNVGEPLKPLARIISGGEMSRFMLALKNITAVADGIGTMVFDEIDSGISGKMGQVVACKLALIAKGRQVLCVSHLPQLAAMADGNFLIQKSVKNEKTLTSVKRLNNAEILEEISRLSGGKDISGFALSHAKDMKAWSDNFKSGNL